LSQTAVKDAVLLMKCRRLFFEHQGENAIITKLIAAAAPKLSLSHYGKAFSSYCKL
jgi:hypothetical protein